MLTNLQRAINKVANEYVAKLKSVTPTDEGKLKNSIKAVITDEGFSVDAFDYLYFLDKGVNGVKNKVGSIYSYSLKKPPINQIKSWANRRGLNEWAVQNSIYNNGIRPRRFISKADTAINIEEITQAYNQDIDKMFNF